MAAPSPPPGSRWRSRSTTDGRCFAKSKPRSAASSQPSPKDDAFESQGYAKTREHLTIGAEQVDAGDAAPREHAVERRRPHGFRARVAARVGDGVAAASAAALVVEDLAVLEIAQRRVRAARAAPEPAAPVPAEARPVVAAGLHEQALPAERALEEERVAVLEAVASAELYENAVGRRQVRKHVAVDPAVLVALGAGVWGGVGDRRR